MAAMETPHGSKWETGDWVAAQEEAQKLAYDVRIREEAISDYLDYVTRECCVFQALDGGPRTVIHQDTGLPLKEWTLTKFRERKPFF